MEETLSLIEKTAFLKSIPVLAAIPTEPLAEVASRTQEMHCEPGQVLYREGDANRGTFIVVEGVLQVLRGSAVVRVLTRGMAFGEMWLREGEPHQYTMTAVEHTHALNVTPEDVIDAMLEYPEFGVGMVRAFALRIHELTSRVLDLETTVGVLHRTLRERGVVDLPDLPPSVLEPTPESHDMFGVRTGPMSETGTQTPTPDGKRS